MLSHHDDAAADAAPPLPSDRLTLESYWDRTWATDVAHDYAGPTYEFHELFARTLPKGAGRRLLELGSARGYALVYLHKEFGYEVHGIDLSSEGIRIAREHCRRNSVPAHLTLGDMFSADLPGPFDVVYSGGVVEHFTELGPVLRRHVALLRPGGTLVLGVPNMRGLHGFLARTLHPEMYAIHNASSCSPWALRSELERIEQGWHYRYCGYGATFRCAYGLPAPLHLLARIISKALRVLGLHRLPNRWFSPDAYVIADRPRQSSSEHPPREAASIQSSPPSPTLAGGARPSALPDVRRT